MVGETVRTKQEVERKYGVAVQQVLVATMQEEEVKHCVHSQHIVLCS